VGHSFLWTLQSHCQALTNAAHLWAARPCTRYATLIASDWGKFRARWVKLHPHPFAGNQECTTAESAESAEGTPRFKSLKAEATDRAGNKTTVQNHAVPLDNSYSNSYSYDNNGNLTSTGGAYVSGSAASNGHRDSVIPGRVLPAGTRPRTRRSQRARRAAGALQCGSLVDVITSTMTYG